MKRKLCSVLLSAVALLLLMGAGPAPKQEATMLAEEEGAVLTAAPRTGNQSLDDKLLIDGAMAPKTLGKTYHNDVTYVALEPMARILDPQVQIAWDSNSKTLSVYSHHLVLHAKAGHDYVEANGRYLPMDEPIYLEGNKLMMPLTTVAKCFDAKVAWDANTGVTSVTRGSGAITHANEFYNADELFWLSRAIYAESGNQPMDGKISVGTVIMNRVANPNYPNTVKGVLAQRNQFSTYAGGALANRTPNASSVLAAKLVLEGARVEETENALYFDSCTNSWAARHRECIAVIGGHKFYN